VRKAALFIPVGGIALLWLAWGLRQGQDLKIEPARIAEFDLSRCGVQEFDFKVRRTPVLARGQEWLIRTFWGEGTTKVHRDFKGTVSIDDDTGTAVFTRYLDSIGNEPMKASLNLERGSYTIRVGILQPPQMAARHQVQFRYRLSDSSLALEIFLWILGGGMVLEGPVLFLRKSERPTGG